MCQSSVTFTLFSFVLASIASGCEPAEPDELELREGSQGQTVASDPEGGVWVNNGLEDPDVSGIDPARPLSSPQGLAVGHGMLLDSARQDTVQYLVECALPEGHSITKHVQGQTLTFHGAIGLAPEWENGSCDEDCQEWVSACLLARTNVSGETVSIWMRADHPAIGTGGSVAFPSYEASFFGNLFADPESQHFCQGTVVGPLLAQLDGRTCTNLLGEPCGFTKYTTCELEDRCAFRDEMVDPVAADCVAGPLGGEPFHTITTYVAAPLL